MGNRVSGRLRPGRMNACVCNDGRHLVVVLRVRWERRCGKAPVVGGSGIAREQKAEVTRLAATRHGDLAAGLWAGLPSRAGSAGHLGSVDHLLCTFDSGGGQLVAGLL